MKSNHCLLMAAACFLLAGCGKDELPPVKKKTAAAKEHVCSSHVTAKQDNSRAELEEFSGDIKNILPEFANFGACSGRDTELLDSDGNVLALLRVAPEKYSRVEGFNGYINTAVLIKDDRIIGIAIGENSETPRWMQKVKDAGFLKLWNGKTLAVAAEFEADAVTGATYSCEAIKGEVKAIVSQ